MTPTLWVALAIALAIPVALVPISLLVEARRNRPSPPGRVSWDRSIPVSYTLVNGLRIRYVKLGAGPPLVLLHTIRTQLDLFQKVIPDLARDFTVYAPDYPGHGWSDIAAADYTPDLFTRFVAGFLEALDLEGALVAGVSIGGRVPLLLSAEGNRRIRGVVAVNAYDHGRLGVGRANLVARLVLALAAIPLLGQTVMRLRNRSVEGKILEGGVARRDALPAAFREEAFRAGERPGHYRAFLNLIRHLPRWREAHRAYGRVRVPVLLVYGERDWSREAERRRTLAEIPGARLVTVPGAGHFLPLDQPAALARAIRDFARGLGLLGLTLESLERS